MTPYIEADGYDESCLWVDHPEGPPELLAERRLTHPLVWALIEERWGR